jgi:hypothetical protein
MFTWFKQRWSKLLFIIGQPQGGAVEVMAVHSMKQQVCWGTLIAPGSKPAAAVAAVAVAVAVAVVTAAAVTAVVA